MSDDTQPRDDLDKCDDVDKEEELDNETFPGAPEVVGRISAWTNRTAVRGLFNITFPWVGGSVCVKWPASGRQAMLEIVAVCLALVLVVPLSMYIIFVGAVPENISSIGRLVGSSSLNSDKPDEYRAPERIQVKTDDGIEIIEACPPCPDPECSEDCPCPACPLCLPQISLSPQPDASAAKTTPLMIPSTP